MMYAFDIHIFGVAARQAMIQATRQKLLESDIEVHYDDRPSGGDVLYTAKKAWLSPVDGGITHRVVLADDVEVCNGFLSYVSDMINAHPDDIISLFPFDHMERNAAIENLKTPYLEANILSGCAIVMPVSYIKPCFDYIAAVFENRCADDEGIQAWANAKGKRILTTIPAIVQHIGDDSIANKGCPIRRTVYYEPTPHADFSIKKVARISEEEWFFSNNGHRRPNKGGLVTYVDE